MELNVSVLSVFCLGAGGGCKLKKVVEMKKPGGNACCCFFSMKKGNQLGLLVHNGPQG